MIVVGMGLRNAPVCFSHAVRAVLRTTGHYLTSVINYLDDVLIFAKTRELHDKALAAVLESLIQDCWAVSWTKVELLPEILHVLGHTIIQG